jgi:hypothetical protein
MNEKTFANLTVKLWRARQRYDRAVIKKQKRTDHAARDFRSAKRNLSKVLGAFYFAVCAS